MGFFDSLKKDKNEGEDARDKEAMEAGIRGNDCLKKGKIEEARSYFEGGLKIAGEINCLGKSMCLLGIGSTYFFLNRFAEALDYQKQALTVANEIGHSELARTINEYIEVTKERQSK